MFIIIVARVAKYTGLSIISGPLLMIGWLGSLREWVDGVYVVDQVLKHEVCLFMSWGESWWWYKHGPMVLICCWWRFFLAIALICWLSARDKSPKFDELYIYNMLMVLIIGWLYSMVQGWWCSCADRKM
jgi:hypothetical protein